MARTRSRRSFLGEMLQLAAGGSLALTALSAFLSGCKQAVQGAAPPPPSNEPGPSAPPHDPTRDITAEYGVRRPPDDYGPAVSKYGVRVTPDDSARAMKYGVRRPEPIDADAAGAFDAGSPVSVGVPKYGDREVPTPKYGDRPVMVEPLQPQPNRPVPAYGVRPPPPLPDNSAKPRYGVRPVISPDGADPKKPN